MKNKLEDLRNHLFSALEGLSDKENPMDLARAKTIADVGRVIVDTAKAEVEFMRVVGAKKGTGFVALPEETVMPSAIEPNGGRSYQAGRPKAIGAGKS